MDSISSPAGILFSFLASSFLTVVYALLIWWSDHYEREPLALLAGSFLWGSLPAVVITLFISTLIGEPILIPDSALMSELWTSAALAPIIEESAKGLALLFLLIGWRHEIDGLLDGLVYGAMIGFGFGLTENLFYFVSAYLAGGWGEWAVVVFTRGVVFGMNHAFFTAFTGAGVGLLQSHGGRRCWKLAPLAGWVLAVGAHAMHNLGASLAGKELAAVLISLFSDGGGLALLIVMIGLGQRQEQRWLREELASEIGVVLTASDYSSLVTAGRRLAAAREAYRIGGWQQVREVAAFHSAATELAFVKQRVRNRGWTETGNQRILQLRQRVATKKSAQQRTAAKTVG